VSDGAAGPAVRLSMRPAVPTDPADPATPGR
jgi:hypothetical protein